MAARLFYFKGCVINKTREHTNIGTAIIVTIEAKSRIIISLIPQQKKKQGGERDGKKVYVP